MRETIIPKLETKIGSITTIQADAIVNPANSFGYMGGGVALAIKIVGGQAIEDEAISHAPIQIGEACLTTSGDLVSKSVIHAPTMHNPAERTDAHKVKCAIEAALIMADSEGMRSIAIPGMGTGVGGIGKKEAAKVMISAIKKMKFQSVERIILVDLDSEMVSCFESEIKKAHK
jgi:O-acetyl-ADP-ribose deacetylase